MEIRQHIDKLREAIETVGECKAVHVGSEIVADFFRSTNPWDGLVEIFSLDGHAKANRCYAWSYNEGNDIQYVTVLEIPPVDSAESAVRIAIANGQHRRSS